MQSATELPLHDRLCVFDSSGVICIRCGYTAPVPNVIRNCVSLNEPPAPPTHGPGTELSKLLKRFGIEPTPTCQCSAMSQKMDQWGCDECERPERIDEVVAVMRAEATARGLPFLDVAGRLLVRRAISNARRNA
jgi:hypothetical protein